MQRSFLEDFFDRMNEKVFIFLIISVQIVFIFQGLDFADSGFEADFYSRIFRDPSSVQFHFMYWFTGIIGGTWLKLFPDMGLLGLRLAGVLFTTLTILISQDLLKKYLHTAPLRISLFLIILFLATGVKELNHLDVGALLFVSAAWFLSTGLTKQKQYMLFLSGIFISLNSFSHFPNLLSLALVLVIWFHAYLNRDSFSSVIMQTFLFLIGFLLASVSLILFMKWLHQDTYFINSLRTARKIIGTPENPSHLFPLIKVYFLHFAEAVSIAMIVMVTLWSSSAAWRRMKGDIPSLIPYLRYLQYGVLFALSAICVYSAKHDADLWYYLFLCYAGMSLIVGFLIVTGRQPKNLRVLAAIGCVMLLAMPFGNEAALMTAGKYAIWIIVPITIDFLLNIRALSSRVVVSENTRHSYEQVIDEKHMTGLRNVCIFLTLIFIVSVTYYYPHFDQSDRSSMRYSINNKHARGIYTTQHRAKVVNELLVAGSRYAEQNDYVLAFDCMPMYYYLSDTRPYMQNPMTRLYDSAVFKEEFIRAFSETHTCPVIIMQKGNTVNSNWPDNATDEPETNPGSVSFVRDFLKNYQYAQVWENDFFRIYVPANKNPAVAENFQ